jgi:hypothetical protein
VILNKKVTGRILRYLRYNYFAISKHTKLRSVVPGHFYLVTKRRKWEEVKDLLVSEQRRADKGDGTGRGWGGSGRREDGLGRTS